MRTFTTTKTRFHYNPDGSGEVHIVPVDRADLIDGETLRVPFTDLARFVGTVLRDQSISNLQGMDGRDFLTLPRTITEVK